MKGTGTTAVAMQTSRAAGHVSTGEQETRRARRNLRSRPSEERGKEGVSAASSDKEKACAARGTYPLRNRRQEHKRSGEWLGKQKETQTEGQNDKSAWGGWEGVRKVAEKCKKHRRLTLAEGVRRWRKMECGKRKMETREEM